MNTIKLGRTGLDVSRLCLGCMSYGEPDRGNHPWTLGEAASRPFIKRALDLGINFFDTANVYSDGTSEEIVGRALLEYARRGELVIATKVNGRMHKGPNGAGLSRKAIFAAIEHYRPSVFFGLPTLYTSLTKAEGAHAVDFSSLRMALSAAEVLSADVFNGWKTLTGLEIVEGLGSTEVLHIYLSNRPERKKLGAAGLRVPGYEIALRDKDGREVGDNEEGVLWVRGDSATPLYWNRPDKSAETIREAGWIYTGDRFVRDGDGFHFFRGRADDLIKISGQWVYPLEVELCLAEHPEVRECAVFAAELPDRRMTLKAIVVMNASAFDATAATTMLQNYVKAKLLPYKYPREVRFIDELPKTGTGKIDRQALLRV